MIETMIFSESFGSKSFNINVDDRQDCMNAIFNDTDFDTTGTGESVKNLYGRYQDIQDVFPADITDDMLSWAMRVYRNSFIVYYRVIYRRRRSHI